MPFGIRSPLEYIEKHRASFIFHGTDSCHCCSKNVKPGADGFFKVVPARFDYKVEGEVNERRALLCSTCYTKQRTLQFNTLEELIEHCTTRQRLPRTSKGPYKKDKVPVAKKSKKSLEDFDKGFLVDLHRMLGEYLELGATCDANSGMTEFLDEPSDDDILAGMTPEQQARMDQAVKVAEARTHEVPQENWGKEETPSGW